MSTPLITVAIPLYRSGRFLDVICQNISNLPTEGVVILLSDRHGDDDALDKLQEQFANDHRIRFLRATDRIDWVDHYNFLLQEATTDYFMWMPHDDTFPPGYVTGLVQDLEANPDAWLSFGDIVRVEVATQVYERMYMPFRFQRRLTYHRPYRAVQLLCFWNIGIPFRGVFNRKRVLEQNLFIRKARNGPDFADVYWMFGVGLRGRFVYNSRQYCLKRYYATSTHAPWRVQDFFIYSSAGRQLLRSYIDEAGLSAPTGLKLKAAIELWAFCKRVYHLVFGAFVRDLIRMHLTGHQKALAEAPPSLR